MIIAESVLRDIKNLPGLTPKHLKQIAIAENLINTANKISSLSSKLGKRARFYTKNRISKRQKAVTLFEIQTALRFGAYEIEAIKSQPIPKVNGIAPGGLAMYGERGEEMIMMQPRQPIFLNHPGTSIFPVARP